ncbi:hypothetical protein [uncultured Bacteroides sp.]|uniref:hypothetical protein n=1 Tax=uncultured Bacteroides sp. TaxID=162156 RepID=UPI002603D04E|nr:hypothetical protein [uncultured Bacteroides sp.]
MAENYSAQNTITIKRLRSNDSLTLTFENNGIPLFQGVDESSGAVSPDWSTAANQPVRTPKVTSARGLTVSLSGHSWAYNGVGLNFNGAESGGWKKDSTGKFAMETATGAIKIVGNLASKTNVAGDTLTYSCVASVAGVEYNLTGELPIAIQNMGASSYYLAILASTEQLTSSVTSCTLTTKLYAGANAVGDYHVKWYKDTAAWSDKNGQKTITVNRSDVDGTQLFIAEVYPSSAALQPIARAGVRIIDTADEFQIVCYITSTNKEVDAGQPVTVSAKIVNMTTGAAYTPGSASWTMDVMDKENWKSLKHADTNSISVTTAETDRNGTQYDVDVLAECHFD